MRARRRPVTAAAVVVAALALSSGCAAAGGLVGAHRPPASPAPGPALEPQQARDVLGRVVTGANQADAARSTSLAEAAYDGLALRVMRTAYRIDSAQGTTVPSRPASRQRPVLVLTIGTSYPRFFFAALPGTKTQGAVVNLLTAKDPSAPYRIAGWATLLKGAHLPAVADMSEGSPVLAAGTTGLVVPPGDLAERYAAVLNSGSSAPEAASFTSDPFVQQVEQAAAAQRTAVARFGSYTQAHHPVDGSTLAVRTSDGGALVFTALRRVSTFTARAGNTATLPADVRVLTDEVTAASFTSTAAEMLVFVDPPAGKGRASLVAATDGLIGASAP